MNRLLKSFGYAYNGLKTTWFEETNFRIQSYVALCVISSAWFFEFSAIESSILFICIGIVMCAEIFNTAIEDLCNKIEPNQDVVIGKIKDTAAAAVIFMSCIVSIVGILVYLSHFNIL